MTAAHDNQTGQGWVIWVGLISAAAIGFLIWLIYFNKTAWIAPDDVAFLPAVNAAFNATSACLVVLAVLAVKRGDIARHRALMFAALGVSGLFLVSYLVYHSAHGDTPFTGQGWIRPVYFFILISHIVLSAIALPLVLATAFLGITNRLPGHRKIVRLTVPIWLYVSVTGVVIFALLKGVG